MATAIDSEAPTTSDAPKRLHEYDLVANSQGIQRCEECIMLASR